MTGPRRMPTVLCLGRGYACQFAGWVLARAGADVQTSGDTGASRPFPN